MKATGLILFCSVCSIYAAPAVVWKNRKDNASVPLRTSEALKVSDLLSGLLLEGQSKDESSLASVVFLIGRGEDGSESLSTFASSGHLPGTEIKYNTADEIHHYVTGIESSHGVVQEARRINPEIKVVSVNLNEFSKKLASQAEEPSKIIAEMEVTTPGDTKKIISRSERETQKRAKELSSADVLIVKVDPKKCDCKELDNAIVSAVENQSVESVVVAGIRSSNEVKHERMLASHQQRARMTLAHRKRSRSLSSVLTNGKHRRLEDEQDRNDENDNANANNQGNDDFSGVYYVHMTPNILSGILFFALFTVTTWIGISCMGMIAGQDVYVKKMPAIGREA